MRGSEAWKCRAAWGRRFDGGWLPASRGDGHRCAGRPDRQPGLLGRSPRSPRLSWFPRSWEWGVAVRPPWRRAACGPFARGASLCLDCRAACTGGPLGPGYLYSLPILQTQAWALPAPMPVGISLLTTVSSRGVQGVYPHDWARSQPRRTSASNYPRCRLIPSTSAGRGCRAVLRLCCKMLSLPSSLKNIHLCSMQQRGRLISPGEPPG